MANFNNIKTAIDTYINTNGSQEITGDVLNSVLNGMIESVDVALANAVKTILDGVSSDFDTLKEIADYIATDKKQYADLLSALSVINETLTTKVDKTSFTAAITELAQSIATKLDKATYDKFVSDIERTLALKLDKSVHEAYVSKTDKAISQKVDKTTYDAAISNINGLIASLGVTIQSLSKQVQELNARVAALEGDDKTSNLIGTAKVGFALLG